MVMGDWFLRPACEDAIKVAYFGNYGGDRSVVWTQRYDPLGHWLISTVVAALPGLVLLVLLATGRASAWKAALAGLVTASGVAWLVFGMPARMVLASA